jgi:hypothetical protein
MKKTCYSLVVALVTKTARILASFAAVVLTLLAMTGCQKGNPTTADVNPAGIYTLITVDGKSLPCDLKHGGTAMTIKSGVFTINADGTCRSLMKFSDASRKDLSREVKATYQCKGQELTMKWEGAGTTKGKVDANKFVMINEGMVLSYQK